MHIKLVIKQHDGRGRVGVEKINYEITKYTRTCPCSVYYCMLRTFNICFADAKVIAMTIYDPRRPAA